MKNQTTDLSHQDTLKYIFIWLISLLSIKFYSLFLSYSGGKALVLFGAILVFSLYIINVVYNKTRDFDKGFSIPIILLFTSLIISTLAANYFYNQSLLSTLFSQFDLYLFLFYFLLHKLRPNPDLLTNMIVSIGLVYCFIYFAQFIIYPKLILSCSILTDRGTIRIFMPGIGYMITAYYIIMSRFLITNRPKYFIMILPILIVLFLLGTRQALGIVGLMTIIMILISKKVKSKLMIFMIIIISTIPIFFIFQDIFYNMLDVTREQSANAQGYVRVRAMQFYLFKFNHNPIWMLVGNGMPAAHSSYGIAIDRITKAMGFYLNDIGIIGDFFRYGILYVLVTVYILIKLARTKLHEAYSFIRFMAFTDILAISVGAGMNSQTVILFCMSMYITDAKKNEVETEYSSDLNQNISNQNT